jgi:DNA-binding NarL/FixJ family response regulator
MSRDRLGVFIVVGNRLLREALTRILNQRTDLRVLAALGFFSEAVEQLPNSGADVLLLDSILAPLSEPESVRQLCELATGVKLILLGAEEDEELFLQAVRAGVVGYVPRAASAADVLAAVRSVVQDEVACPPRLCRFLFSYVAQQWNRFPNGHAKARLGLTRREQQLIPMIAQGLTNKEIAGHLNLSEQTVKNHVHRILRKVGSDDRLDVVDICRAQGWAL